MRNGAVKRFIGAERELVEHELLPYGEGIFCQFVCSLLRKLVVFGQCGSDDSSGGGVRAVGPRMAVNIAHLHNPGELLKLSGLCENGLHRLGIGGRFFAGSNHHDALENGVDNVLVLDAIYQKLGSNALALFLINMRRGSVRADYVCVFWNIVMEICMEIAHHGDRSVRGNDLSDAAEQISLGRAEVFDLHGAVQVEPHAVYLFLLQNVDDLIGYVLICLQGDAAAGVRVCENSGDDGDTLILKNL